MKKKLYAADLKDIRTAGKVLEGRVHRTPIMTSSILDQMTGHNLFFKCEHFQRVGAFKIRGATYAIDTLTPSERAKGVVTHSSGNHAQAIALAAREYGVAAHIVMPTNSPRVKQAAVVGYGAQIYPCEPTLAAREATAAKLVKELDANFIPPYNDARVISGQGTVGLELHEQVSKLDAVLVPIGGGGLCSGVALALRELAPNIKVYGVEPAGADDAMRSKKTGQFVPQKNPKTIADGLRTSMGDLTWPVIRDVVVDVLTVSEEEIIQAMRLIWSRMKMVVEPSAAVPLAAVLAHGVSFPSRQRLGLIITGGNVDLDSLPWHG